MFRTFYLQCKKIGVLLRQTLTLWKGTAVTDPQMINQKTEELRLLERIATALEKIAGRTKRKSIGAVFGNIVDHAHKHLAPGSQHPDEYSYVLLNALMEEYPTARYPADITRYVTPEVMESLAITAFESDPTNAVENRRYQAAAQNIVLSLRDAGFWED